MTQDSLPVLVVEDTATLAFAYASHLRNEGLDVETVASAMDAIDALGRRPFAVVILDLYLPDGSGFDVLRHVRDTAPEISVIVVTADDSVDTALEATRLGAWDYLVKPVVHARLVTTVRNAFERTTLQSELTTIREGFSRDAFHGFVGRSPAMQIVYSAIENVAGSRATVFVTGESGTGKEVCAEAIHASGPRRVGPFIAINCGAIPGELMESELFGHVKGAFTGATTSRDGAASLASGGTLFLDEICEMELQLQTKLLRFLQTGTIQRVGSARAEDVDVRVICATNRDPDREVREGRFREDLYYRLNVIPIDLPPLRERGDDVVLIARTFLSRFAEEEDKDFVDFTPEAAAALARYVWPGNVRELQNIVRRVVVMHDGSEVVPAMLPGAVRGLTPLASGETSKAAVARNDRAARIAAPQRSRFASEAQRPAGPASVPEAPAGDQITLPLGLPLRDLERRIIEATLAQCGGSIPRAAAILEVSPSTLYRKKESWEALGDESG